MMRPPPPLVAVRRFAAGIGHVRGRHMQGALLIGLAAGLGCARPLPPPPPPPIELPVPELDPWPGILAQAHRLVEVGDYAAADRVLAAYAIEHQGTPEGAEADFWRALFKVDPLNRAVTTREKYAALDTYLHGGPTMPRYLEVQILRRLMESVDSTRAVVAAVQDTAEARATARDDEVRRISEELDKAVAELERIRRRLVPRPPDRRPPPP